MVEVERVPLTTEFFYMVFVVCSRLSDLGARISDGEREDGVLSRACKWALKGGEC